MIAVSLLMGLIPLLFGLLLELVVLTPVRVPLHQSPIYFLWQVALQLLHFLLRELGHIYFLSGLGTGCDVHQDHSGSDLHGAGLVAQRIH